MLPWLMRLAAWLATPRSVKTVCSHSCSEIVICASVDECIRIVKQIGQKNTVLVLPCSGCNSHRGAPEANREHRWITCCSLH